MTMVSYAQNGEDVMLMRALGHVAHGFYVDVGAANPTEHSVTRAFYDRGWHGVNVEPSAEHFPCIVAARPRDVNLNVALDARDGEQAFHQIRGTGLSTLDPLLAERHGGDGWVVDRVVVQTLRLSELCERYAPETIHFLKIDVEGAEARVLQGADFTRHRPWIVLVEATRPGTRDPNHEAWEAILLEAGYEFVWFDGLNRFYLAAEQADALRGHFAVPLNLFDGFTRHDPALDALRADAARAPAAEASAAAAQARAGEAEGRAAEREAQAAARVAMLERGLAEAAAQAEAARGEASLLAAQARTADALAQAATTHAQAAAAQAQAAQARLGDLQHEINESRRRQDELRQREEAAQALLAARHSDATARLALLQRELDAKVTAHDRLLRRMEAVEHRGRELEAELAALVPPEPAPVVMVQGELLPDAAGPVALPARRRLAARLYGATLRPLVRPVAWRSRTFLVEGLRQALDEQAGAASPLHEQTFVELRRRADKVVDLLHRAERRHDELGEAVGRVQDRADELHGGQRESFVELRARADKVVDASHRIEDTLRGTAGLAMPSRAPGPAPTASPDLTGLAASMEAALLTLAVAGRGRGR